MKLSHACKIVIDSQGEGNGTPLQYSCLENPMDGAWKAAVHGVAEGREMSSPEALGWRRGRQPTPDFRLEPAVVPTD